MNKTLEFLKFAGLAIGIGWGLNGACPAAVTVQTPQVGYHGYFQVGRWAPLTLSVTSDSRREVRCVVEVLDPDGCPAQFCSERVRLEPGRSVAARILFRMGRLDSPLTVRLMGRQRKAASPSGAAGGENEPTGTGVAGEAWSPIQFVHEGRSVTLLKLRSGTTNGFRRPLRQSDRLVLTLGHPAGLAPSSPRNAPPGRDETGAVARSKDSSPPEIRVVVELESPERLPTDPRALASVEAVVVAGQYALPSDRVTALRRWVRSGGHLIIAVGSRLKELRETPLGRWLGEMAEMRAARISDLSGIELLAGRHRSIPFLGRIPATVVRFQQGTVLASTLDGPVVVRRAVGFGQITVLGMDLDRPPLSEWGDVDGLCEQLLQVRHAADDDRAQQRRSEQLSYTGINDLASQLHAVQDYFPEIRPFSSWFILGLMFVYLLVVGPLDYLVTHRLLQRPQWTWFTLPVAIILASAVFIWTAQAGRGHQLRVNQLDLLDIDEATSTVRGHCWLAIYSPEHKRYRVEVEPLDVRWRSGDDASNRAAGRSFVCWNGIPEKVIGGMYRPAGFEIGRPTYRFSPRADAIDDLSIAVWSTRNLVAQWHDRSTEPLVRSRLRSTGVNQLTGTFSHSLPAPIEDWILAYRNTVFRPVARRRGADVPKLAPNRPVDLGALYIFQRELRGYLTRTRARRVTREDLSMPDILVEQTKYDAMSRDPAELMQMLTFHEAAGGTRYTGLTNQTWERLDLSPLLRLDRAVLFGRIQVPVARLKLDGQPVAATRHTAFVRLVMPVREHEAIRKELPKLDGDKGKPN
ncbi:MAG TPA: DUF4350 domain-containing protein [Planctomycetaceae bacterium]|nr:DUF4350 domain-containing protein [Planctomycetaceae bacterium]